MREVEVRRAEAEDAEPVAAAYADASADEAVNAWILRGGGLPAELFESQLADFVAGAIEHDEVWIAGADDQIWGVAVWYWVGSTDRFEAEADQMDAAAAEYGSPALHRAARVARLMARAHPRAFPHLYLHSVATVPQHRGKGAGAAMLSAPLERAARAGTPAYLESSTDRAARLYERLGFAAEGEAIALPDGGPKLIPMWRR